METIPDQNTSLRELTAQIVKAYVSNNHVPRDDLPSLIGVVHEALKLDKPSETAQADTPPLVPAVSIKKSVTPDYIVCLEDGKQFKSLRRHLQTHYDLSPEAYRAKWGLPADYPMVAANYAAKRSELAKSIGLGRKRSDPVASPATETEDDAASAPEAAPAKRRAARKNKADA